MDPSSFRIPLPPSLFPPLSLPRKVGRLRDGDWNPEVGVGRNGRCPDQVSVPVLVGPTSGIPSPNDLFLPEFYMYCKTLVRNFTDGRLDP